MKREEIIEKVNSLLSEEFEVDAARFTPDANVRETLSLDSLSLVDLVAIIQQTYRIKIPVAELPEGYVMDTINYMVKGVCPKCNKITFPGRG